MPSSAIDRIRYILGKQGAHRVQARPSQQFANHYELHWLLPDGKEDHSPAISLAVGATPSTPDALDDAVAYGWIRMQRHTLYGPAGKVRIEPQYIVVSEHSNGARTTVRATVDILGYKINVDSEVDSYSHQQLTLAKGDVKRALVQKVTDELMECVPPPETLGRRLASKGKITTRRPSSPLPLPIEL